MFTLGLVWVTGQRSPGWKLPLLAVTPQLHYVLQFSPLSRCPSRAFHLSAPFVSSPLVRRREGVEALPCEHGAIWVPSRVSHCGQMGEGRGSWTSGGSDRGVERSIHHDHARLTMRKMECCERLFGFEGPGNSKQYFLAPVRLSNKGGRYMNYLALM